MTGRGEAPPSTVAQTPSTPRGATGKSRTRYREAHGVFVGVDDVALPPAYNLADLNPGARGLSGSIGATNDVQALATALEPSLASSVKLIGADATRSRILSRLEDVVQSAVPGDLVIAYFSAYAVTEYDDLYLIPHDFEPGSVLATAVSFRLASAVLGSVPDVQSLLILDACHAAAVGFEMSRYNVGSESGLMVSSGPMELSFSRVMEDGLEHGHFSWGLVQAFKELRGAEYNWSAPIIDWFDKAYNRTTELDNRQHPVFLGTLSPNLELRPRRGSDA